MRGHRDKIKYERLPSIERETLSDGNTQIRWNFKEIPKEEDVPARFSYDFINVKRDTYNEVVSAIIRKRYSQDEIEAILANYAMRKDVFEYIEYQAHRKMAKEVARGVSPSKRTAIKVIVPMEFVLSGGKYEQLADRILKMNSPYELVDDNFIVYLEYIEPEHEFIRKDPDLKVTIIEL